MNNISIIVAVDKQFGISLNNKIPWNIKEDTLFFNDVTKRVYKKDCKNALIVGKNTWLLLNEPFKDRITFKKLYLYELPEFWGCNKEEEAYLNLIDDILKTGHFRQTRNSKTWSKFGKTLEFDLSKGFPLLTSKRVFFRGIFEEILFML